jgi:hypothetical protein
MVTLNKQENGNAPAQAVTQDVIEDLTRRYARARDELSGRVSDLEAELARVKRGRIRGIRGSLARALDARAALERAIELGKALFVKPRTLTVDGIGCNHKVCHQAAFFQMDCQ